MKTFLIIVAVLIVLFLALCYGLFRFAFVRFRKEKPMPLSGELADYADITNEGIAWFKAQEKEEISLTSFDGIPLKALYLPAENPRGTIILMSGYRSDGYYDFGCIYKHYHDLGLSILNPFQRAHGMSGGKYISLGIKERFDCRDWVNYLRNRFGENHKIVLGGVSMGASTVLMATGLDLPDNVRCVIADCGFCSPYEVVKHVMKTMFHLPEHPILDVVRVIMRILVGCDLTDYTTAMAMQTNTIPILFLHGEADSLVPHSQTVASFNACRSEKRFISVPGAEHGMSYLLEPERCQRELKDFLDTYLK